MILWKLKGSHSEKKINSIIKKSINDKILEKLFQLKHLFKFTLFSFHLVNFLLTKL